MYGYLCLRKAYLLWAKMYVQLDESLGALTLSASPIFSCGECISLDRVTVSCGSEDKGRRFTLRSKKKRYHLRAASHELRDDWVLAIKRAQAGDFAATAIRKKEASPARVRFQEEPTVIPVEALGSCEESEAQAEPSARREEDHSEEGGEVAAPTAHEEEEVTADNGCGEVEAPAEDLDLTLREASSTCTSAPAEEVGQPQLSEAPAALDRKLSGSCSSTMSEDPEEPPLQPPEKLVGSESAPRVGR
eukprot:RCo011935